MLWDPNEAEVRPYIWEKRPIFNRSVEDIRWVTLVMLWDPNEADVRLYLYEKRPIWNIDL